MVPGISKLARLWRTSGKTAGKAAVRRAGLAVESLEGRLNLSAAGATGAVELLRNSLKTTVSTMNTRRVVSLSEVIQTSTPSTVATQTAVSAEATVTTEAGKGPTLVRPGGTDESAPLTRSRPNRRFSETVNLVRPETVAPTPFLPAPTTTLAKQFQVAALKADMNAIGGNPGFSVHDILVKPKGSTGGTTTIQAQLLSITTVDANTVLEVFQTAGGEATITATLITEGADRRMEVTVAAGAAWTIESITLGAPRIFTQSSSDLRVYDTFKGGQLRTWAQDGYHAASSAAWPNMSYSPLVVFYNQKTTEGVAFTSFDAGLEQRQLFWVTGPGEVHPYVRWDCLIEGGTSQDTTMHEHHAFNMPTEQFRFYRETFLVPFMESEGVQEGTLNFDGAIGLNFWPQDADVVKGAQEALDWGAKGYLQYTAPGTSWYFEPNPQTQQWYPTLKNASGMQGLELLGVLIDPLVKSTTPSPTTDPMSPEWFPSGEGKQSLADPDVQRFLTRLKTDLAADGVNFAFWDMGSNGGPGEGRLWFDILKTWKEAGISIMAESSCDIASYVTGTNLIFKYDENNDYTVMRSVTPKAQIGVIDQRTTTVKSNMYWWEIAEAKGFIAMLSQSQLPIWSRQHGF